MQDLMEKIKEKLQLSDEDVKPFLDGDFKTLMAQNKDAAVRSGMMFVVCLIFTLIFLGIFSQFGALFKLVMILVLFGPLGIVALKNKDTLIEKTHHTICSYLLISVFGLIALAMFSDISAQGSFFTKMLMILVLGGLGAGLYTMRQKAADAGVSVMQMVSAALVAASLPLMLLSTAIRFSIDQDIEFAQRRSEIRRQRDAEKMRNSQASMKVCASEEECRKMNMKKNSYYEQYEEVAQDVCESAVAKEITGRFEWTVSAKDYKFNKYEVDVLKDEITLFGDFAQLIANNGGRTKVTYTCRYYTKKKTARASVQPVK